MDMQKQRYYADSRYLDSDSYLPLLKLVHMPPFSRLVVSHSLVHVSSLSCHLYRFSIPSQVYVCCRTVANNQEKLIRNLPET